MYERNEGEKIRVVFLPNLNQQYSQHITEGCFFPSFLLLESHCIRFSMTDAKNSEPVNNDEHPINRPPKAPGQHLGPYLQFLTTDLKKNQWFGSILLFQHVSFDRPTIELLGNVQIESTWETLEENLWEMRAYRINLTIDIATGDGDEKIVWKINWGDSNSEGSFYIPRMDQLWRGGFFSCNGFDATIPKERAQGLNYDNVWNHLHSIHQQTPLHVLLWGGDQSYNDFVIEDVPFLQTWSRLPFAEKWTHEFTPEGLKDVEKYYFYTYAEHWERRPEMKRALSSIPGMMMWDDHDIFDGAGSYPVELQQSPIMKGLFDTAQRMRLLFQHHTTVEKARGHQLFGYEGYNYLARCGRNLAILGADGRSERTTHIVQHEKTWDMIFEQLDRELNDVKHLIVLFPIPFSFVRLKLAETILERWKNFALRSPTNTLVTQTNSVFGLPEIYDDLLDEWIHENHMPERDRVLKRLQALSEQKKIRITFFSGDVHCCGVSRFRTHALKPLSTMKDSKLMYQIISSAIVNMPPPRMFIRMAHFFASKWYPAKDTIEEVIDFFEQMPEDGSKLYLRKLLPNRNWCYFEQNQQAKSIEDPTVKIGVLQAIWSNWSTWAASFAAEQRTAQPIKQPVDDIAEQQSNMNNLKIQFWLEGSPDHALPYHQRFTNYDLYIPHLD